VSIGLPSTRRAASHQVKVTTKTALIIGGVFVTATALVSLASDRLVAGGFAELEEREARENVGRVVSSLRPVPARAPRVGEAATPGGPRGRTQGATPAAVPRTSP